MTDTATRADELRVAYRHDAHKFYGQPHGAARETLAGVPVNQPVPYGADSDAAALSRPDGTPEQTVANHRSPYRLSLLDGTSRAVVQSLTDRDVERAIDALLLEDDPVALHRAWLDSDVAAAFNESIYYPYTSLKYHTLLVAALVDTARDGHSFEDLSLIVDEAEELVPHRTIYAGDRFTLRIDTDTADKPSARLDSHPRRSWAPTWANLSAHPLAVDHDRYDMVLDANLRRIRAWSTALQYLEEFQTELKRSGRT